MFETSVNPREPDLRRSSFTALEASGAPIIAMMGEPLRVSYANASARAVFGDDPGLRLLSGNDPARIDWRT